MIKGMTRTEYLVWHANGNLWVRLLKMATEEKRHCASCSACGYTVPIKVK